MKVAHMSTLTKKRLAFCVLVGIQVALWIALLVTIYIRERDMWTKIQGYMVTCVIGCVTTKVWSELVWFVLGTRFSRKDKRDDDDDRGNTEPADPIPPMPGNVCPHSLCS